MTENTIYKLGSCCQLNRNLDIHPEGLFCPESLASLLTTMVASNSNFGNNMIVMQTVEADINFTYNDNVNTFDYGSAMVDYQLNK